MGQSATKPKDTKSSQRLEEKTKETRLPPIRVVDNAATKPKDNKYSHWHWLEEKADKTGLPYLTDVHRTGKELGSRRTVFSGGRGSLQWRGLCHESASNISYEIHVT